MTKIDANDDPMKEFDRANLAHWDEMVGIHLNGAYSVDEFRSGASILDPLVTAEIGELAGTSLLHLQCHFGLDTLSFARLGANVTGIDYAPRAIAVARELSAETGVPGRFVHCRVEGAPDVLDETFERVFTSWGAICWLPDLGRWAEVIAQFLKPGGIFYMIEGHPLANAIDDSGPSPRKDALLLRYPCLSQTEPMQWTQAVDYADEETTIENATIYDWNHDLGTVVTALCDAGLRIEFLREHPVIAWRAFPELVARDRYYFELPEGFPRMPLSFSIRAHKPA